MIQKLLAGGMRGGGGVGGFLPAFLYGLGSISKMVFSSFFYHSHCSINIAIIIRYYFLKIVELWRNSQKRKKGNKMEEGGPCQRGLPGGIGRASPAGSGLGLEPLEAYSWRGGLHGALQMDLLGNASL